MAKNCSNESNKNRSGASNTKNTFVENCGYRSENNSNKILRTLAHQKIRIPLLKEQLQIRIRILILQPIR